MGGMPTLGRVNTGESTAVIGHCEEATLWKIAIFKLCESTIEHFLRMLMSKSLGKV